MSKTITIEEKEYIVEPSFENNELVELTDEQAQAMAQHWHDAWKLRPTVKLEKIRRIRNAKLLDTDWLVISEQITEAQKTWRTNLRNIPQDYSEADYDDLLATDEKGNLTHTVWSKP